MLDSDMTLTDFYLMPGIISFTDDVLGRGVLVAICALALIQAKSVPQGSYKAYQTIAKSRYGKVLISPVIYDDIPASITEGNRTLTLTKADFIGLSVFVALQGNISINLSKYYMGGMEL